MNKVMIGRLLGMAIKGTISVLLIQFGLKNYEPSVDLFGQNSWFWFLIVIPLVWAHEDTMVTFLNVLYQYKDETE